MKKLIVNISNITDFLSQYNSSTSELCDMICDIETFGSHGIAINMQSEFTEKNISAISSIKETLSTVLYLQSFFTHDFVDTVKSVVPHGVIITPKYFNFSNVSCQETWVSEETLKGTIEELHSLNILAKIVIPNRQYLEIASNINADGIVFDKNVYKPFKCNDKERYFTLLQEAVLVAKEHNLSMDIDENMTLYGIRDFIQKNTDIQQFITGKQFLVVALYFGLENAVQMYLSQLS